MRARGHYRQSTPPYSTLRGSCHFDELAGEISSYPLYAAKNDEIPRHLGMTPYRTAALGSGLHAEQHRKPGQIGEFVVGTIGRVTALPIAVDPDASPAQRMGGHDVVLEPLSHV